MFGEVLCLCELESIFSFAVRTKQRYSLVISVLLASTYSYRT